MSPSPSVLTIAEVARELRCSKAHVCKIIHGQVSNVSTLPAIAVGRRLIVRRSTLEQWMRANERAVGGTLSEALEVNAADA